MSYNGHNQTGARGLGFASIGIGLAELVATRQIEKLLGLPRGRHTGTLRVLGVREVVTGLDILSHRDPTPGVWARVAGDALDLALLGVAVSKSRSRGGVAAAFATVAAITAVDVLMAKRLCDDEDAGESWGRRALSRLGDAWIGTQARLGNAWDGTHARLGDAWDGTQSRLGRAWDDTRSGMGHAWNGAQSRLAPALESTQSRLGPVWQGAQSRLGDAWHNAQSGLGHAFQGAQSGLSHAWDGLSAFGKRIPKAWHT